MLRFLLNASMKVWWIRYTRIYGAQARTIQHGNEVGRLKLGAVCSSGSAASDE
jgi:hypothetical protein